MHQPKTHVAKNNYMELIKIFLSYASEDYLVVSDFYDKLKKVGINPWMDKRDIFPGENWERSIWRAVKNADFIILFLSNNSVNKRGFFQKEIKTALKLWEEKLEDDIYIIPVIIEKCEIPKGISGIQWIDYSYGNSFNKIIASINEGASRIGKSISFNPETISINNRKIQESKSKDLSYLIDVEYPQFEIIGENIYDEVNNIISGKILEIVHNSRKEGISYLDNKELRESLSQYSSTNDLYISYKVKHISKKLLSLHFTISTYYVGAAHSLNGIHTMNYELNPTIKLDLFDIFNNGFDYLNVISDFCIKDLIKQLTSIEYYTYANNPDDDLTSAIEWIKKGAKPEATNYEKFCINEESMIILFDDYQVGPFSWGHRTVEIPWKYFKNEIKNKSLIDIYAKKLV